MATVNNEWKIPLDNNNNEVLRNGVRVRRAFGGFNAGVDRPDLNNKSFVNNCTVSYWYRELYPNDEVIKDELKTYTLQDLAETTGVDVDENQVEHAWRQEALAVLTGFIMLFGQSAIVDSSLDTLGNAVTLPLDAEPNYPHKSGSRIKIYEPII